MYFRLNSFQFPIAIDKLDISPHAFRLYIHLKCDCVDHSVDECPQPTTTLAKYCHMTISEVLNAMSELVAIGLVILSDDSYPRII